VAFVMKIFSNSSSYEFQAPPRFKVSEEMEIVDDKKVWRENWEFEGLEPCSGNDDAKTRWENILAILHPETFDGFTIYKDIGGSLISFISRRDADCLVRPRIGAVSLPSSGADAAWATNIRYSFTVSALPRYSDLATGEARRNWRVEIQIDELGFMAITESGEVEYSEEPNHGPLPRMSPSKRRFESKGLRTTWSEGKRKCSYSYSWKERRFVLDEDMDVVGLQFSCNRSFAPFFKRFEIKISCGVPKAKGGAVRWSSELGKFKRSGGAVRVGMISSEPDVTPTEFLDSLPPEAKDVAVKIEEALVPSSAFDIDRRASWDSESRNLSLDLSYSVLKSDAKWVSLSFSLDLQESLPSVSEFKRAYGRYPILFFSGNNAKRIAVSIRVESLSQIPNENLLFPRIETGLWWSRRRVRKGVAKIFNDGTYSWAYSADGELVVPESSRSVSLSGITSKIFAALGVSP